MIRGKWSDLIDLIFIVLFVIVIAIVCDAIFWAVV